MVTLNHSTSIEVPHCTAIKVLQQGTSIKVPNRTLMDVLHMWLKNAEGVHVLKIILFLLIMP